jgi:D-xylose transport system permease protein
MSGAATPAPPPPVTARPSNPFSVEAAKNYWQNIRSGDLGPLPIILGLILIALIFQSLNENFLTSRNLLNLVVQMAGITTIAIGVVFVLLLGEIDLSISYTSAVSAVLMTELLLDDFPWWAAIGIALIAAAGIGLVIGVIVTKFKVPSFVVTLAGFLGLNGVVLLLIGSGGTVVIQDDVVIGIANEFLADVWGWVIAVVGVGAYAISQILLHRRRKAAGVSHKAPLLIGLQVVGLAALAAITVSLFNDDRGFPVVGLIVLVLLIALTWVADRTTFGRHVYAVGGNEEAARRAGINTDMIKIKVFMLSSALAGAGGIILASRLRSVDTAAGGGSLLLLSIAAAVIGGTSLFGGRGRVIHAFYGALIIVGVENGMGLLGLSAGVRFVVTALVLLAAVVVDALSRRGRMISGRA